MTSTADRNPGAKNSSIDGLSLAGAAGTVSAVVMALIGALGAVGMYEEGVEMMEAWHIYFEPTVVGTVAGMVEAFISVFVFVYLLAVLYNVFIEYR